MERKILSIGARLVVVALAIALALSLSVPTAMAVTPEEKEEAIEKGLKWLDNQQDPTTGAWDLGDWSVSSTAFAVIKFAEHAKKFTPYDPFDPAYEYSDEIAAGLKYIFEHAVCVDINMEPAGDPDVNLVNGMGVYFLSPGTDRPLYETGIVMMALEASCHPEFEVNAPGSCVNTWTYENVMRDTVDYVAWAQNDDPNPGRGGWRYGAYDDGIMVGPGFGAPDSDNSCSQWPVLGLMSAEAWLGPTNPPWVKTELEDYWLAYSQHTDGCFGYTAPGSYTGTGGPVGVTASGLIQLTYCGVPTTDSRWVDAAGCICTNWGTANIGNLYAMYGVMKAGMTAQPEIIWDFCGHEWQPEYDEWLLANQVLPDGYWEADGYWVDRTLATEMALLILQKVAPLPPPPVPTLSQWGMVGMAALFLAFLAWTVRRRRLIHAKN